MRTAIISISNLSVCAEEQLSVLGGGCKNAGAVSGIEQLLIEEVDEAHELRRKEPMLVRS